MQIKIVATLPKVNIEGDVFQLRQARLVKLPFDDLLEFEKQENSGDYDKQRFSYIKNPPVFFEKWITVDDKIYETDSGFVHTLRNISIPYINTCAWSLYFYTGKPLFSPVLSSIYFDMRTEENFNKFPKIKEDFENFGVYRCYGESDKEFTFLNVNPNIFLTESEQQTFGNFYLFIESKSFITEHEELQNVFDALNVLSLPGINYGIELILIIGAIEAFLLPDKKNEINQFFKKRFYNLCNQRGESDKLWMNQAYSVRSEIIHGRDGITKLLGKLPCEPNAFSELLIHSLIIGLCRFFQYANDCIDVKKQLDEFREMLNVDYDSEVLNSLRNKSNYEVLNNTSHQWKSK